MEPTLLFTSKELTKSTRALEIDLLVYFIRMADLPNARQLLVNLLGRGERVSREIVRAYEHLECRQKAA